MILIPYLYPIYTLSIPYDKKKSTLLQQDAQIRTYFYQSFLLRAIYLMVFISKFIKDAKLIIYFYLTTH